MATVTPGYIFQNNEVVTPTRLNSAATPSVAVADDEITTAKILNAAVTTAKIADAAITTAKISDSNVTTAKIADASITTAKLVDTNVTTAKIADASITTAKLADASVTSDKLANGAVSSSEKITNGIITAQKLNGNQSGSAPIFGCRAWVNFDGSKDLSGSASTANTARFIRASGNVASVIRNSTGRFTINFITELPDANGCVITTAGPSNTEVAMYVSSQTNSSVTVVNNINAAYSINDPTFGFVAVFR